MTPIVSNGVTSSGPLAAAPMGRARATFEELFGIDLRSLALLRIGLGVSVLADVIVRAFDLTGLYTDQGVLPRDLLLATEGRGVYLSAHFWASAHPLLQTGLFVVTAICAVALLAGWRTRLATLACWYLVASVQIRQPLGYMGGDSILRLLLFWALFLPLSARFSLDAVRGRVRPRLDRYLSGATAAVLLQVGLIYWATGFRKSGELWWSGQAVFHALHLDEWATPLGIRLRDHPGVLELMTYGTLGLELLGPFFAFVPVYTAVFRLVTVGVFWAFHLGLATTMNIGLFPLFSVVAWLPFVPTAAWMWLGGAKDAATSRPSCWRERVVSVVALVCLAYVLVLVAERARTIPRVLPAPVIALGTALRLQQTWNMFAPDPPSSTRVYTISRTRPDGSRMVEPASTSFRWTAYLSRVGLPLPFDRPLAQSLRRFALLQCLDANGVERVSVLMHAREIDQDGHGAPTTTRLVEVQCPSQKSGGVEVSRGQSASALDRATRLLYSWELASTRCPRSRASRPQGKPPRGRHTGRTGWVRRRKGLDTPVRRVVIS